MTIDTTARSQLLRSKVLSFCQAFLDGKSPQETLSTFFTSNPKITEHGPSWAMSRLPFLGKTFSGWSESEEYFKQLASTLSFHPDENTFPPPEGFIVDPGTQVSSRGAVTGGGAVSVVAHAKFASVKTGKGWEEDFIYRLSEFDEEGKIGHWEIWADPLSAWEAVGPD